MTDSGCLRGGYSWTNEWMESFADPDIFGHFTASWYIEGVLPTITNSDDYAVCAGPQYFIWGGSYALVNPQCKTVKRQRSCSGACAFPAAWIPRRRTRP